MKYALQFFFLIVINSIYAQNGSIEGEVVAQESQERIQFSNVYLENTSYGVVTDKNGHFLLQDIPNGAYSLIISNIGFNTFNKNITVQGNESSSIQIELETSISSLNEITVITGGASKVKGIAGSAHFIGKRELQAFSYSDVNQVLAGVAGVNIQQEDGFGLRPNIGFRGTGVERSSKITIMEDGVLAAPAPYSAPAAYYFPSMARMESIEIIKGSSQIEYGPFTNGGALNFVSTSIPDHFKGFANVQFGSFGARKLHFHIGDRIKQFSYVIESLLLQADGFKELGDDENTGFDKSDYVAKIQYRSKESANVENIVQFKIGHTNEVSNETYLGLTKSDFDVNPLQRYFASSQDQMNAKQHQYGLFHTLKAQNNLSISSVAYYNTFERNWYKLDAVKDAAGVKSKIATILDQEENFEDALSILHGHSSIHDDALFVKANNRSYEAKGIQTVIKKKIEQEKATHQLILGIRYHEDQMDRFQWIDQYAMKDSTMVLTDSGEPGSDSNRIEEAQALATYFLYDLEIGKFTLSSGLRYESIVMSRLDYGKNDPERLGTDISTRENHINVVIPGVGFKFQHAKDVHSFAGIHRGFAPSGSNELTEPELSMNYEIGFSMNKRFFEIKTVLFVNDYSNLLGADLEAAGGSGTNEMYNGGEVITKGAEFEMKCDLNSFSNGKSSIPLSVSYTLTNAEFKNSFESEFEGWGTVEKGNQLPYLANHQITAQLAYVRSKYAARLAMRYKDAMYTKPGNENTLASEMTDANFMVDLNLQYYLSNKITFSTGVTNLLDQTYVVAQRPAGLRPGMPRAFTIGFMANF